MKQYINDKIQQTAGMAAYCVETQAGKVIMRRLASHAELRQVYCQMACLLGGYLKDRIAALALAREPDVMWITDADAFAPDIASHALFQAAEHPASAVAMGAGYALATAQWPVRSSALAHLTQARLAMSDLGEYIFNPIDCVCAPLDGHALTALASHLEEAVQLAKGSGVSIEDSLFFEVLGLLGTGRRLLSMHEVQL